MWHFPLDARVHSVLLHFWGEIWSLLFIFPSSFMLGWWLISLVLLYKDYFDFSNDFRSLQSRLTFFSQSLSFFSGFSIFSFYLGFVFSDSLLFSNFTCSLLFYSLRLFTRVPYLAYFPYNLLLCFLVFVITNLENMHLNVINNLNGGDSSSSVIFENPNILNVDPLEVN